MQTLVLWAIYIALFVIIFALIAAATRSVVGIAWGFLIAALLAMIITGIVSACTCYGDMDFFRAPGVTCLGGIMILMVIIGVILVIAAYVWRYWKKSKCNKTQQGRFAESNINEDLSEHPSCNQEEYEYECDDEPVVERYQHKSVHKSKIDCSRDRGCKGSGSLDITEKIRKRNRAAV